MPINPLIGAGLISGIGSLGASLVNAFGGQQMSKDLMDYQYKLNQQAIDAQNLYNSPAEQMKRLAYAGLNPNLVYGSGVDGNQSSAPSVGMSNRQMDIANPLQDFAENIRQQKLLDLAEIKNRNEAFESVANRHLTEAKTLGQLLDNSFNDATMKDRIKIASQKLANMVADESKTYSDISLNVSKSNVLQEQANYYASLVPLNEAKTITERLRPDEIRAGINLIKSKISLNSQQEKLMDSMMQLNDAKMMQIGALITHYGYMDAKLFTDTVWQTQMNQIGVGNMTNKDKTKTLIDIFRILAGLYSAQVSAGAGVAKAAL